MSQPDHISDILQEYLDGWCQKERTCERCGSSGPHTTGDGKAGHFREWSCGSCGRHLGWIPKPESEKLKRPNSHRNLVKRFGNGFCELCLIRENELPEGQTLEADHIEQYRDKWKGSDREIKDSDVLIVCTRCHKLVTWLRHWCVSEDLQI